MKGRVSPEDRKRLIDFYQNCQDFLHLADILGINQSTARTIIRRHRLNLHTGKLGGHKLHVIDSNVGDSLINFVELNPLSTLLEMQSFLEITHQLKVCFATIANYLDGKLISIKRIRIAPLERNSDRVKELRFQFARWHLDYAQNKKSVSGRI